MKYIVAVLLSLACLCGSAAGELGKETRVDSVLASVNGEPITLLDVMLETSREELRLASLYSGARLYSEIAKLRKEAIEEIIVRKLIYAKYKEKPFPIDNQYIEDMMDHLAMTMAGGSRDALVKQAEAMGTTMKELKEKAKEKIAVDALLGDACERPIYITPKEVYDYYEKNGKEWTTPARYTIGLLLISRSGGRSGPDPKVACKKLAEQLKKADRELFTRLVRANSDAANAENGGLVEAVEADKLRPEFSPSVRKMKPGEIAGPLETPEGFYFLRLEKIQPEEKIPFEKASGEIRKRLEDKEKAERRKLYGEQLKKQALIRYFI